MSFWSGKPETLWFFGIGDGTALGFTPAAITHPPSVTQWVRCSAASTAGSTSVKVDILSASILNGTTLAFSGGTRVTLSSVAAAGDSSLSVTATTGAVAEGETASGSVNVAFMRQTLIAMSTNPTILNGRPT